MFQAHDKSDDSKEPLLKKQKQNQKLTNLEAVQAKIITLRNILHDEKSSSGVIPELDLIIGNGIDPKNDQTAPESYKTQLEKLNGIRTVFGQTPLNFDETKDPNEIERLLKTLFTDLSCGCIKLIDYINVAIDSQDQTTNTPLRNFEFYLDKFGNDYFKKNFTPGSPSVDVAIALSAVFCIYYVADAYFADRQKQLNNSSAYVYNQFKKNTAKAQRDEEEEEKLLMYFNIINTKHLLTNFDNMLAALEKDISEEINKLNSENNKSIQDSSVTPTPAPEPQKPHGFIRFWKWFQENKGSKALYPIWIALFMYSMGYWIIGMTTGYIFGVGLAGALSILGAGVFFGVPAIIPIVFLAIYGGYKLYQYYKQNRLEKNLNETGVELDTLDVIKEQREIKEGANPNEAAQFQTYVEMQAFEYKRRQNKLLSENDDIKQKINALKENKAQEQTTEEPIANEPEAIKHLKDSRFKRILIAVLVGGVSGYMMTQFAFGPLADLLDILKVTATTVPVVGDVAAVVYLVILGVSLIAVGIFAAVRGANATHDFNNDKEAIDKLENPEHKESLSEKLKKSFDKGKKLFKEREKLEENKKTALAKISMIYGQLIIKRAECERLSKEVDKKLNQCNKKTGQKFDSGKYNPHFAFAGADNDEFYRAMNLTESGGQKFRRLMSIIFPGWDGWGSGMYIARSMMPLIALITLGTVGAALTGGWLVGVLVTGLVLSLIVFSLRAYRSYMEQEVARDRAFLQDIEARTESMVMELEVRQERELYLQASLECLIEQNGPTLITVQDNDTHYSGPFSPTPTSQQNLSTTTPVDSSLQNSKVTNLPKPNTQDKNNESNQNGPRSDGLHETHTAVNH